MAVTFRGSLSTPYIEMGLNQNQSVPIFAIVNSFRSRVKVRILRIVMQMDVIYAPTSTTADRVVPFFRSNRCASMNVSGGLELKLKVPFDTQLAAFDSGVKILHSAGLRGCACYNIIATSESGNVWQQYGAKQASQVEQFYTVDNFMLPACLIANPLELKVGEALVINQIAAIPTGAVVMFNLAWEEDSVDAGYAIAGNVKAGETNIEGAKVFVLTDSSKDMVNPELEVLQTNSNGNFSKTLASDVKASVFVQHRSGEDLYTDEGKPYIEKE